MNRLSRHGGGAYDQPQQRQPGQGFGSRVGANGPAGYGAPQGLPNFSTDIFRNIRGDNYQPGMAELRRSAGLDGGGGSVTSAIQQMRRGQGLPVGNVSLADPSRNGGVVGPRRPVPTNLGGDVSRVAQSFQGQSAQQQGQNGKGPSPYFQQRQSYQQPNMQNYK